MSNDPDPEDTFWGILQYVYRFVWDHHIGHIYTDFIHVCCRRTANGKEVYHSILNPLKQDFTHFQPMSRIAVLNKHFNVSH